MLNLLLLAVAVDFTIVFYPGKSITPKQPDKKPRENY